MAKREAENVPLSRFGVLVAQLESIAAAARQQPPDALLCFDLLSELVAAIEEEPQESILQWQRKCEDALYSLLILGARRPVRRLASSAMAKVIAKGDGISIYSRASSLQGWLADGKRSEALSCAGAAQCLGDLYRLFGRRITSGLVETTNIASKLMKFHEDFVRQDALQMLENALEGCGGNGVSTAYSEAFRIIMRMGVNDKSYIVRLAAARCLKTFASIGGPGLAVTEIESSITYSLKALEDPLSSVRDVFSEALGALLALAMNPEAQVKQRGKSLPGPGKKLEDVLQKYLIFPFTRASGIRMKTFRVGLALAWVYFLQVIHLKYHFPDSEIESFASQALNMLQGNASMDAHALACVLYILRVGITDQMSEPTQRIFLVHLAKKLESADYSPPVGVAVLRILSYLLTTLGEVPVEFKEVLDDTVVAALSHSSKHVRIEAALTVRALAEVDPTCVGGLISFGVTTLHALRESAAIGKGNNLNLDLDSLHGQATVLAALVSISPKLVLGYPSRLPKSVFEVSRKMLTDFSRLPAAACVEKEAGWLLLASLISSMPKEELDDQVFDVLLLWAGPFVGDPEFHISRMQDLYSEIHVLSAAIEALTAFIRSFVFPTVVTPNGAVFLQPVVAYLSGALSYISSFAAKQLPNLKPALDLFTIRTLMAYQTLLNPMTYKSEHPQILQLCSTPFSDPSKSEESSCLRVLLDKRDACLGPWIPGRDWFEDELRTFDGSIDGILPCVWDDVVSSFPRPESISKMLVNQKLLCFGTIFASQDSKGKLQLLNMIDHCLKTGKKQSWHVASVTNACVALLTGLKAVLALRPQTFEVELLSSMQSIFQGILADGEICVAQRRASAEGLGLLARLGNDIFTARMMRSLLGDLSVAADPNYIGSIAFSLGCIHRCAGGMALSTLVPATVTSISTLARSSNPGLQLFSLHALLLTIEAAGLSYISQVQATLFLAIEVLLSEESGLVDLRQEIGRLINAIVAVLGPELAPGSTFFSRCKSVIAEISTSKEASSLLESVRFTQQLVLFAPHAVPVHHHVQSLLSTLFSRQPSLRHLAVSTLRHLIEKDPVTMTDEQVEEHLFSMLDEETDTEIASLIRATIIRLLYTSCSSCPSRWLTILHNMVLATSKRRKAVEYHANQENGHIGGASEGDAKLYYGEDDEDMISGSGGEQMQGSVSFSNMNTKRDMHLRYTTRVFAAECLSHLPMAVGTDPVHFDLSLSRRHPYKGSASSGDWLVLHLQEMISLSYQISTGQFESMQPIGVKLLSIIMDKFGKSPDPELPGHLLLEQYQAQLVSAVRSSISTSSGPLLLEAGLQLATKILTSSIICEDRVALNRMFSLILRPLNDIQDLYYPSFAEWVACKIKVRLLAAHASIKCYVYSFLREQKGTVDEYLQLIPQFSNSSSKLGMYWIDVLKDYVHICFCLQSKPRYKPFLDGIKSSLVSSKVQECLEEAWPLILQATVLDAAPVKFEFDRTSKNRVEDKPEDVFISGHIMVTLEPKDFQFIWGLALFALFQQHQSDTGKQGKALPTHLKKKESGDSVLQEKHDFLLFDIPLSVLQSMSKKVFFNQEFLDLDLCMELIQILIYADYTEHLLDCLVIYILSQIVQFCQDGFFETEDFTFAAFELCLKCLSLTFQSDSTGSKDLLSELSIIAERIANCMDHKNQGKVIISLISICYECFKGASTELCISKIVSFLWRILPFIKKCFQAQLSLGEYTHLKISLGAWASMFSFLCQDCIRRMHLVENKMSSSFKLLARILASCLEEAIALARLVHETQCLGQKRESDLLLVSVFKCCIKCIQDTLYDTIIQVRAIGLHVLKSISQRELAEGTQMRTHSFFLLFCGELFGDLFLVIQNIFRHDTMNRDSIAVIEECLRLLFVVHTLSRASEHLQAVTRLLLEALIIVFSAVDGRHQEELREVRTISKQLVAHLVQSPSNTILLKDVMLSMSVARRQQLQDMIRASVTQTQMATQTSTSSQYPINKLNMQPDPRSTDQQLRASDFLSVDANKPGATMEVDDDDEDWDAFQSLPADNSSVPISDSLDDNTGCKTAVDQSATASNLHVQVFGDIHDGKDLKSNEGNHMTNLDSAGLEKPLDSQSHYDEHVGVDSDVGGHDQEFPESYQPSKDANEPPAGHSAEESGVIVMECTSNINDKTRSVNCSSNINEELISEQLEGIYGEGDTQESGVIVMECTSNTDDTTRSVNHSSNVSEELISEKLEGIYGEGDTQELLHSPSTEESEERIRCTSNVDEVIGPALNENFENNKDFIGKRSDEIHGEVAIGKLDAELLLVGSNAESEERTVGFTESGESSGQTVEKDEEPGKE